MDTSQSSVIIIEDDSDISKNEKSFFTPKIRPIELPLLSCDSTLDETLDKSSSKFDENETLENLKTENDNLKIVLCRLFGQDVLKYKGFNPKSEIPTPLGMIFAADNSPRGVEFIKEIRYLIEKNQDRFRKIEDREFSKFKKSREKLKLVNFKDNYPKNILQIFPNKVEDKSIKTNLVNMSSIDEMIHATDKTLHKDSKNIEYNVDDDMVIDNLTQQQRHDDAQNKYEKSKNELFQLKKTCFNCGSLEHRKQDCKNNDDPIRCSKNYNRMRQLQSIIEDAEEFLCKRTNFDNSIDSLTKPKFTSRKKFFDTVREPDRTFVPGKISDELRHALGLKENELPAHIYEMRNYGYPPGWLKNVMVKQTKPLNIIDNIEKDNSIVDLDGDDNKESVENEIQNCDNFKYLDLYKFNVNKLIGYPGFNLPIEQNVIDFAEDDEMDEGEINNFVKFDPEQDLSFMKRHLIRTNNKINKILGKTPEIFQKEILMEQSITESEESEIEEILPTTPYIEDKFTHVTPVNPDNIKTEKGLPSLEAFSAGVAPFERNMIIPDVKRGTFKKLSKLLERNRKRKAQMPDCKNVKLKV